MTRILIVFAALMGAGMTSQACLSDRLATVTDDLNVLPAEDFARVAAMKLAR